MKTGDDVRVTNLDGETAEGEIVDILATTVSEYTEGDFLAPGETLLDYWRNKDVDPNAPVVTVRLGEGLYAYPADRVEVIDE